MLSGVFNFKFARLKESSGRLLLMLTAVLFCFLLFGPDSSVKADFNNEINYQGKLTGSSGSAVADDRWNLKFQLCSNAACDGGSDPLWTETREDDDRATTTSGLFSVLLGEVASLDSVDFNQTLYLEVQVGGTSTPSYETLLPRKKLGAVPAAFESSRLSGIASSSFLRSDIADIMGVSSAGTALTVRQDGSGNIIQLMDGANTVFSVADGGDITFGNDGMFYQYSTGRLGLGTTSPDIFRLQIAGNVGPDTDGAYSLGSSSRRWANLYIGSGALHIGEDGDDIALSYDTANNYLTASASQVILASSLETHRTGLQISRKDDDEIYVSAGSIEINGAVYKLAGKNAASIGDEPGGYSSDQCNGGTPSASTERISHDAGRAFDNINNAYGYEWSDNTKDVWPDWIQYQFAAPERIVKITIAADEIYEDGAPASFDLKASASGSFSGEEVTLYSTSGLSWTESEIKSFTFANSNSYAYYRIYINSTMDPGGASNGYSTIGEIEMMEGVWTLSASTDYYVYIDAPASGDILSAGSIIISSVSPVWDDSLGAYYKTGDTTQRYLGKFITDGSGYIQESGILQDKPFNIPNFIADGQILRYNSTGDYFEGSGLYALSSGNVGIGTSSPLAKLDVYGNMILSGSSRYLNFGSATSSAGYGFRDNSGQIEFKHSTGDWAAIGSGGGSGTINYGAAGALAFYPSDGTAATGTDISKLYFDNSTGRLGIGTTSPLAALDAYGSLILSGASRYLNFNSVSGADGYGVRDNSGTLEYKNSGGDWAALGSGGESYGAVGAGSAGSLAFYSSAGTTVFGTDTSKITWDSANGRLGIGTSSPMSALSVMSEGNQFTLGYDADHYVNFSVNSSGDLNISSSLASAGLTFGSGEDVLVTDLYGNVGIGTSSPLAKLDIYGGLILSGSSRYLNFGTTTGTNGYGFRDNSGTIEFKQLGGGWAAIGSGGGSGAVNYGAAGALAFYSSAGTTATGTDTAKLSYDSANGELGIGTNNPGNKLTVYSSSAGAVNDYLQLIQNDYNGSYASGLKVDLPNSSSANGKLLELFSSGESRLRVLASGGVAIGTGTPLSKLDVYGSLMLSGLSRFINFGAATSTDGYGLRDNNGVMEYKNSAGDWLSIGGGYVASGTISAFYSSSCPGGWVAADGTNGAPDLRGRVVVGVGTGNDGATTSTFTLNQGGGEYKHTQTTAEIASHNHGFLKYGANIGLNPNAGGTDVRMQFANDGNGQDYFYMNNAGSGTPFNVMQPYRALIYCMKTSDDSQTTAGLVSTDGSNTWATYTNHNFGIGTTTPSSKLTVVGTSSLQNVLPITNLTYSLGDSTHRWNEAWVSTLNLGTSTWSMTQGANGRLSFFDAASGGGNERLTIATSGNVGLGVIAPTAKLHLPQGVSYTSGMLLTNSTNGTEGLSLWYDGSGNTSSYIDSRYNNSSAAMYFRMKAAGTPVTAMTILGSGDVGIGMTPATKLDVAGSLRVNGGVLYLAEPSVSSATFSYSSGKLKFGMDSAGTDGIYFNTYNGLYGDRLVIKSSGLVGIGTDNPGFKLDVHGTICQDTDGNGACDGTVSSDARLKTNVADFTGGLNIINNLRAVNFNWRQDIYPADHLGTSSQIGFIAQELEHYLPELIYHDMSGFKMIDYQKLTVVLTGAIQEMSSVIDIARAPSSTPTMAIDENGNVRFASTNPPDPLYQGGETATSTAVAVFDFEALASTTLTAFVVNQEGDGDIADFQKDKVSVMNINNDGIVKIVGDLLVDGRVMTCSGGVCPESLENSVESTFGDMGVEGKVVAGEFEGYCNDGYIWIPGSAKYGTMPGFCVMARKAGAPTPPSFTPTPLIRGGEGGEVWLNITQAEAQLSCQSLGSRYHLISENEWLTIAENIIRVADNDIDPETPGLQLATSTIQLGTTSIAFKLANNTFIHELVGEMGEWTDQAVKAAGLVTPLSDDWIEYNDVEDYKGFNLAPPYYYDSTNGIGMIKTGTSAFSLFGFVRGNGGIYSLDLSNPPSLASESIGFRCAR